MDSQRNILRRAQAVKVREGRVITGYVQKMYPKIYAEATAFYNVLNDQYPSKYDLRKTVEFMTMSPSAPLRETQNQKKKYRNKPYPNNPHTRSFRDNFELRIQLMDPSTEASDTTELVESTSVEPAEIPSDSQQEPDTTELMESTMVEPAEITINDVQPTLNGYFTNEAIDEIIAELQKDADLVSIFDDIDVDMDVDIPDVSPLEVELSRL